MNSLNGQLSVAHKTILDIASSCLITQPIDFEALCVCCWEMEPSIFGLKRFEDRHPNFHIFRCNFYGKSGLLTRKLVEKRLTKFGWKYYLTEKGYVIGTKLRLEREAKEEDFK